MRNRSKVCTFNMGIIKEAFHLISLTKFLISKYTTVNTKTKNLTAKRNDGTVFTT